MPLTPDDQPTPLGFIEYFLKLARKIDETTTGAVVFATGASLILGLFAGGASWMPFVAFASLLVFRTLKYLQQKSLQDASQRAKIAEIERSQLEAISASALSDAQKAYLEERLTGRKPLPPINDKQLPP